jgi:death-on-curing protein
VIKFGKEKVLLLHQLMTEETGGSAGVRDYGLLDSALESAFQTFDKKDLYPTNQEKAAKLGHGLVANHAFIDGNKRIGMYVMLTFLEVNGIPIDVTNEEVIRIGIALADGSMKYDGLLQWIKDNQI